MLVNMFAAMGMQHSAAYQQAMNEAMQQRDLMAITGISQMARGVPSIAKGDPCGGCGSRETMIHRGARMCAYCRSDR